MVNDKKARRSIHLCSVLGAGTAAALPPLADAVALASEETIPAKVGVATGVMEALGWTVNEYYKSQ